MQAPACTGESVSSFWDPAAALARTLDADYVGVVYSDPFYAEDPASEILTSEYGERCADVEDVSDCTDRIEYALEEPAPTVIVRRAGALEILAGEDLMAALTPVETMEAAILVALGAGYLAPICERDQGIGAVTEGGREVDNGFELVLGGDNECSPTGRRTEQLETHYQHLILVTRDGHVEDQAREPRSKEYCEDFCSCREVP